MQHSQLPVLQKHLSNIVGKEFKVVIEDYEIELLVSVSAPVDCDPQKQNLAMQAIEQELAKNFKVTNWSPFFKASDWDEMLATITVERL